VEGWGGVALDLLRRRARDLRNSATDAERMLWRFLRGRQLDGFRFRRQVPIAGFIADFACPEARLIIEIDGGHHAEQVDYDRSRSDVLRGHGYRIVRYWNNDVLTRTEDVLADIQRRIAEQKRTPSQPPPFAARKGEE
jgi:very-short-patch-repair endonuclease